MKYFLITLLILLSLNAYAGDFLTAEQCGNLGGRVVNTLETNGECTGGDYAEEMSLGEVRGLRCPCICCVGRPHVDFSDQPIEKNRLKLQSEIKDMIKETPCEADKDCSFLPMGDKPCGGPWGYIIFSNKVVKEKELAKMVKEYDKADRRYNEINEMGSTCDYAVAPTAHCVENKCVAKSGQGNDSFAYEFRFHN